MPSETTLVLSVAVNPSFLAAALSKLNERVLGNTFDIKEGAEKVIVTLKGDETTKYTFTVQDFQGEPNIAVHVFGLRVSALNSWWAAVFTHKLAMLLWQGSILYNDDLIAPKGFGLTLQEWNAVLDEADQEMLASYFWEIDVKQYGNLPATKKLVAGLKKYFPHVTE